MKILQTGSSTQSLSVIPRLYSTNITLTLRDDQTNEVDSYSLTTTTDNDYMVISNIFDLTESHFYDLTVLDESSNVLYKDKVFCTDQDIDEANNDYYTVNKDEYTVENTYDNDYIIL